MEQFFDFVLGETYAQDMDVLAGIGASTAPISDAAAQLFDHELPQQMFVSAGENQCLNRYILLMQPVQHHDGKEIVNDRIDGYLGIEENQEGGIEEDIKSQREFADGEAASPLTETQTDHVQAATAAAAGEDDSAGDTRQDAA